jgi:hypothetical protein
MKKMKVHVASTGAVAGTMQSHDAWIFDENIDTHHPYWCLRE